MAGWKPWTIEINDFPIKTSVQKSMFQPTMFDFQRVVDIVISKIQPYLVSVGGQLVTCVDLRPRRKGWKKRS